MNLQALNDLTEAEAREAMNILEKKLSRTHIIYDITPNIHAAWRSIMERYDQNMPEDLRSTLMDDDEYLEFVDYLRIDMEDLTDAQQDDLRDIVLRLMMTKRNV